MRPEEDAADAVTEKGHEPTAEDLQRGISAALETAQSVLSTGILGKLLADLVERHKKTGGPHE